MTDRLQRAQSPIGGGNHASAKEKIGKTEPNGQSLAHDFAFTWRDRIAVDKQIMERPGSGQT
jgi:hypothetical protein